MNEIALRELSAFLEEKTANGLYPIVAYGLDANTMLLLTTNIADLPFAMNILEAATGHPYNLGYSFHRPRLEGVATANPHVFKKHEAAIAELTTEDLPEIGRVVSIFGAPFFKQKAFALVDICGFSRLSHPEQLSQLYSLINVVGSSTRRAHKFCERLRLRATFGRTSTGDGYYLWHDFLGGNADVATFMLLLCVVTQAEAMRRGGFPMRLRASYVIDSAFMIYSPDTPVTPSAVASNAVGRATHGAARLITAAKPSQILVADFARSGQAHETMDPHALIAQANELFREESAGAASLGFVPDEMLRVTDKHGDAWYCWNLVGHVPNALRGETIRQPIGLSPDQTKDIAQMAFNAEPFRE